MTGPAANSAIMIALALTAVLAATPPAATPPAAPASLTNPALNCTRGFAALTTDLDKKPGLIQVAADMARTERFQSPTEQALYTVTLKGHPAYPAIVRQYATSTPGGGASIGMLACGYSKRNVLQPFMNTFPAKNTALRQKLARGEHPFGVQAQGVPNPGH